MGASCEEWPAQHAENPMQQNYLYFVPVLYFPGASRLHPPHVWQSQRIAGRSVNGEGGGVERM